MEFERTSKGSNMVAYYRILSLLCEVDHVVHKGKIVRQHRTRMINAASVVSYCDSFTSMKGLPTG